MNRDTPMEGPQTVIAVSGLASGVGKTRLACLLLSHFKHWNAMKVTICHRADPCPRAKPCGVCARLDKPFAVITDPLTLGQRGTDTGRMREAGARHVIWLQCAPEFVADGVDAALMRFRHDETVVLESNSAVPLVKPTISIMVMDTDRVEVKASAQKLRDVVDICVICHRRRVHYKVLRQAMAVARALFPRAEISTWDVQDPIPERSAKRLLRAVRERLGLPEPSAPRQRSAPPQRSVPPPPSMRPRR